MKNPLDNLRNLVQEPVIFPTAREMELVQLFERKRIPPVYADILSFVAQKYSDKLETTAHPFASVVWDFVNTVRIKASNVNLLDSSELGKFADEYGRELVGDLSINTNTVSGKYLEASLNMQGSLSLAIRHILETDDMYRLYDIANSKLGTIFTNDARTVFQSNNQASAGSEA